MQPTLRWVCPLVILALVGLADAADTKDKPTTKEKVEKMVSSGQFIGKLTKIEGSTKNFTVQITYPQVDPVKALQNEQFKAKRLFEIGNIRNNRFEQQKQLAELTVDLAKRQRDSIKQMTKDIDLQGIEKIKVRRKDLPIEFDDKNKPKKYTAKEKAALKGRDKSLPGYTAEWENLNAGQTVKVYLAKMKSKPKKTKDKAKGEDDPLPERPQVNMIMIMAEAPPEK